MDVFVLITNTFWDDTIILLSEEPLFILITFVKPHFIFVLTKLHFGVFMGKMLSPLVYFTPYRSYLTEALSCQNLFYIKSNIRLSILYIRLTVLYIQLNNSYIQLIISYIQLSISYL